MIWHHRLIYRFLVYYWRVFRPIVLGSRVLVIDQNRVLLVKMTYTKNWYLPGGGVGRRESFLDAARRELREECGLIADRLDLFGLYTSLQHGKTDHLAVYVAKNISMDSTHKQSREISETGWFAFDQLPKDVSPATRRRIEEYQLVRSRTNEW